jgi:hypothetical protein
MRRLLCVVLLGAIAGCGAPPEGGSPTPVRSASTPSAGPSSAPPAPTPSPTPAPDFTELPATSATWTNGEIFLVTGFRHGVGPGDGCRPRREELPPGATDGVECADIDGPAERVGAYLFPDDATARAAYEARLHQYGVTPGAPGPCSFVDGAAGDGSGPEAACFTNEFGVANLRMFWPSQSVVVGVLGRSGSVDELAGWARGPDGDGAIDVWQGGSGTPRRFDGCPDVARPAPVDAPVTFLQMRGELVLRDPSGLEVQRIQMGTEGSITAEWSPDGRQIAYVAGKDVWLRDPDAERSQRLATLGGFEPNWSGAPTLVWSPDGRWLGYTEWTWTDSPDGGVGQGRTGLIDVGSGAVTDLVDGWLLGWSPDSSNVLVRLFAPGVSVYPDASRGPIGVVDRAGNVERIGVGQSAAWSPDCRYVAIAPGYTETGMVVHEGIGLRPRMVAGAWEATWAPIRPVLAASMDDGALALIDPVALTSSTIGRGERAAWSLDGSRLAYAADGLVVADGDGSGSVVVAGGGYPLGVLDWSPDGRFIASYMPFSPDTCGPPSYAFIIAADGSSIRALDDPYDLRWRPVATESSATAGDDEPPEESEGCGG